MRDILIWYDDEFAKIIDNILVDPITQLIDEFVEIIDNRLDQLERMKRVNELEFITRIKKGKINK